MRNLFLLYLGFLILSGCTLEPYEGASSSLSPFVFLGDTSCVTLGIKNTKEIIYLSEEKSKNDYSRSFWGKKIETTFAHFDYKIEGFKYDGGRIVIQQQEGNTISYSNNYGHLGVDKFTKEQRIHIANVIDNMNTSIKTACKLSLEFPKAKTIDR